MSIRVVDNQKLEMSDSEFELYKKIVKSYTSNNNKGEDLFIGLFQSDEKTGIIQFLIPPNRHQTSLEIYLFLMSLMQNQHLRILYDEVEFICGQMKNKMQELDAKLERLENKDPK
jgi:hypothetical protein